MATIYKSKFDTWLIFILIGLVLITLWSFYAVGWSLFALVYDTVMIAVMGTCLWCACDIKYIVNQQFLTVKTGFISSLYDIKKIKSIKPSNSILSAPAGSIDRIEIKYGKSSQIIISPKDKYNFINHLIAINPEIDNFVK